MWLLLLTFLTPKHSGNKKLQSVWLLQIWSLKWHQSVSKIIVSLYHWLKPEIFKETTYITCALLKARNGEREKKKTRKKKRVKGRGQKIEGWRIGYFFILCLAVWPCRVAEVKWSTGWEHPLFSSQLLWTQRAHCQWNGKEISSSFCATWTFSLCLTHAWWAHSLW